MKKQLLKSALIAVASVGLLAGSAMATMINGTISLTGVATLTNSGTTIDFLGPEDGGADNYADVDIVTGDFSSFVTTNDEALMTDLNFSTFTPNTLWTVGGFSFYLTGIDVILNDYGVLFLSGTGIVSGNGYEDTVGTWLFSGQGTKSEFTWSAGTTAVPEPATMLLFGTGIAGLAGIARRKN